MRIDIVPIGNSKGLRLSKSILTQCGIHDAVNLEVRDHTIVITPCNDKPRKGWGKSFQQMSKNEDDVLIDFDLGVTEWDENEWQW